MKFTKKPVTIEAVQFLGIDEGKPVYDFADDAGPDWLTLAESRGEVRVHPVWPDTRLQVVTREDDPSAVEKSMIAEKGDWIICGVKGELYPCKPEIFEDSYTTEDGEDVPSWTNRVG